MKTINLLFIALIITGGIYMFGAQIKDLKHYQNTSPKADIQQYFNGKIKAWGIIQDWRGRVVSRFDVDMIGSWNDNVGTLEEDFSYYNGEFQKRIWTITKQNNQRYIGQAEDIVGQAQGQQTGSALFWRYEMNVPVNGRNYRLRFDDWMWQMNEGVLINRSYIKKFGFTVAELTLFMKKQ